ncbi:peptidylprolyl isomerase [Thiofaba sp. EF100]|uniref:peptidylprolyl isomerase n=1 Tax=Thiofaba sp. EF100 TaxID=3121274 RepID=UPI003222201D
MPRFPIARPLCLAGILLALGGPLHAAPQSSTAAVAAPKAQDQGELIPLDRVVAIVNNEAITERELAAEMARITNRLRASGRAVPPTEVLLPQVLERMMIQRAELQYAKLTGITVDDLSLDNAVRGIANDNGMSIEQFRAALAKEGTDWAGFREQVRQEIILGRLHKREVFDRMQISDKEIDDFLASRQVKSGEAREFHVRHILVALPENAGPAEIAKARAKAEAALKELQGGAEFAGVAARFSDARDALEGGDLGWRPLDRLPTVYAEAAQGLKAGQLSELLRSPSGFHIIQLAEVRGAQGQAATLTETHARHILIQPRENVSDDEARRRLAELRERILKGEDFAALARTYSDDKGSAERGGDLGWARPGMMVEAFEQVMNATAPGQVSEPFRSPFGWHIVQVLERRDASGNAEFLRQQAREAIGRRKAEEELERWQRRLKDEAYTEILIGNGAGK